ncbi:MAG: hypothetical protein WCF33_07650, partial [Pseudonocardiaceae bacterium]
PTSTTPSPPSAPYHHPDQPPSDPTTPGTHPARGTGAHPTRQSSTTPHPPPSNKINKTVGRGHQPDDHTHE